MRTIIAAALVGASIAGLTIGAARADYTARQIGNWNTNATEDRFGDGGTFTALTFDGSTALAVRCIRKKLSIAIARLGGDPKPMHEGDKFEIKFKVDKQPIVEAVGLAIQPRLVQVLTEVALVKAIRDGRETAMRLAQADGVAATYIFKTAGAKKAFADLSKDCPLE